MKVRKWVTPELKASTEGDDVVIEGYANKRIVDSMGDLVEPGGVDLSRYKRNPIIFYNHDRYLPVGKATDIQVKDDGLWIKVVISKSKDAIVSLVRDMVREGILKTFSIGFQPMDETRAESGDHNVITKWMLHEVSVVTLPANVESEFALAKQLGEKRGVAESQIRRLFGMKEDSEDMTGEGSSGGEDSPSAEMTFDEIHNAVANEANMTAGGDQPEAPAWVASPEQWQKAITVVREPLGEDVMAIWAHATWLYLNHLKGGVKSQPSGDEGQDSDGDENPDDSQQRQAPEEMEPVGEDEEDLKKRLAIRSQHFGIEALSDGALQYPADAPTDLALYGDPVNLRYPMAEAEKAGDARAQFKQQFGSYQKEESKAVVHNRIVARQLALGLDPDFDATDSLDALLSDDLKEALGVAPQGDGQGSNEGETSETEATKNARKQRRTLNPDDAFDETDFGSVYVDLGKSQVAMLGHIASMVDSMREALIQLVENTKPTGQNEQQEEPPPQSQGQTGDGMGDEGDEEDLKRLAELHDRIKDIKAGLNL